MIEIISITINTIHKWLQSTIIILSNVVEIFSEGSDLRKNILYRYSSTTWQYWMRIHNLIVLNSKCQKHSRTSTAPLLKQSVTIIGHIYKGEIAFYYDLQST